MRVVFSFKWVLLFIAFSVLSVNWFGHEKYFLKFWVQPTPIKVVWEDLGFTPNSESNYTPQAIEFVGDRMLLAVSEDDKRTRVHIFEPNLGKVFASVIMPKGANHTSGFSFYEDYLWATDYYDKYIYQLDASGLYIEDRVAVIQRYPSGLEGLGSIAVFEHNNHEYILVTEFLNSRSTYVLDKAILEKEKSFQNATLVQFMTPGYSQGIVYHNGLIIEAINQFGRDAIYVLDFDSLLGEMGFNQALVKVFNAPSMMVEDLAIKGDHLYTSDEYTSRLYRVELKSLDLGTE